MLTRGPDGGYYCQSCAGGGGMSLDEHRQWEKSMMDKAGFFIHRVPTLDPQYINCHTHGFDRSWQHHDFQIVLPLPMETIENVFWNFAERVKKGTCFRDGDYVEGVIRHFPVRLAQMIEGERPIIRILFPDKNGLFPGDADVEPFFGSQMIVRVEGDGRIWN